MNLKDNFWTDKEFNISGHSLFDIILYALEFKCEGQDLTSDEDRRRMAHRIVAQILLSTVPKEGN